MFSECFRVLAIYNLFKILENHVVGMVFRMRSGCQVFATVGKQQCVGIDIVEDFYAFLISVNVDLGHCIKGVQHV